ncbi:MAG: hypothetical protein O3B87_05575 [bacterium]|nr:hypothetical protein [bacterium]
MLQQIVYLFPDKQESDFQTYLFRIFEKLPNSKKGHNSIIFNSSNPSDAKPETVIQLSDVAVPEIYFEMEQEVMMKAGNLCISNNKNHIHHYDRLEVIAIETKKTDSQGSFIEHNVNNNKYYTLPLGELYNRIASHIVRIDHTGVNLPAQLVTKKEYDDLISKLSLESNIYKYPTGENWPFILPATKDEFNKDIVSFPIGREPKFELVYDQHSSVPTFQFDIETDLTRSQVELLLPKPYGISFPDLADYFRTVYIYQQWKNVYIRFDIRFKNDTPDGDWETGKWLVKEGGRISS